VWDDPATEWALQHYGDGYEENRLQSGAGLLECARTVEILQRHLPPPPARNADVGSDPGPYSIWLARLGHQASRGISCQRMSSSSSQMLVMTGC
jgi:hypothetical protein